MRHPYENLPEKSFWSSAVARRNSFEINELWESEFPITPSTRIATFGSCFAQHIGASLRANGYTWLCTEPPPIGLTPKNAKAYGYNVFSCRTGNIYTTSLLAQWTRWATGTESAPDEHWCKDDRIYDPFRPRIEPDGFGSVEEMLVSRQQTISSFREALCTADIFVFTMGLTESWHDTGGWEYPLCPGTVAGDFDAERHVFVNQGFPDIRESLLTTLDLLRSLNQNVKVLLTVSPVPLTATKSGKHVLAATMYSKSVLRAVAGSVSDEKAYVDYFPSYEIINSPVFRGAFFESNQRNVSAFGVSFVMKTFFESLNGATGHSSQSETGFVSNEPGDEVCDEELLDAFRSATA